MTHSTTNTAARFQRVSDQEMRSCRNLRSKQPAASEGDGRVFAVGDRVRAGECDSSYVRDGDTGTVTEVCGNGDLWVKWDTPKVPSKDGTWCIAKGNVLPERNTSKQAAGEAVALFDAAVAEELKRVSGLDYPADKTCVYFAEQVRARLLTPPRHPAEEGVARDAELRSPESTLEPLFAECANGFELLEGDALDSAADAMLTAAPSAPLVAGGG